MAPLRFDLFSLLTAASLASGIVIAFVLFLSPSGNRKANTIFGIFLLLNGGTVFSLGLSTLTNLYLYIPHVVRTGFLFQLLLNPCLYFYFRFLLTADYRFRLGNLVHLLLPVAYFIWHSPFYFSSADNKIRFVQEWFYSDIHAGERLDGILLPVPFVIQMSVYLVLIIRIIRQYHSGLNDRITDTVRRRVNWGLFMAIGWGVIILVLIGGYLFWSLGFISLWTLAKVLLLGISLFILFLAFNALRQPDLLENSEFLDSAVLSDSHRKGSGYLFMSEEVVEREYNRLLYHMSSREYWRDPELNLNQLAYKMGLSRCEMSRLVNTRGECNFHEFVNGYRLREVLKIMKENPNRNILDMAIAVGFANKSTFYKLFKEQTGQTPTEYIRSASTVEALQ